MRNRIVVALLALSLIGCGLPNKGVYRTEKQTKTCERLGNTAMALYGGGFLVVLGGFAYGAVTRDKTGFVIFGGGWASGMIGLGILGYMQNYTGCQMP